MKAAAALLAAAVLAIVGTLLFLHGFTLLQTIVFGAELDAAGPFGAASWRLALGPLLAALAMIAILRLALGAPRPGSIGAAQGSMISEQPIPPATGFWSAMASLVTLGGGGSAGREGPVVHLAATLAGRFAGPCGGTRLPILAAVAAATASGFNAPLGGALFALEIVGRRRPDWREAGAALLAGLLGAAVYRLVLREGPLLPLPAIAVPEPALWAGLVLAALAGGGGGLLLARFAWAVDALAGRLGPWYWLAPLPAGMGVALLGLWQPAALGTGQWAAGQVLGGALGGGLLALLAAKLVATALTVGGRFGGGIFGPTLVVGALAGALCAPLGALPGLVAALAAAVGGPLTGLLMAWELTGEPLAMLYALPGAVLGLVMLHGLRLPTFFDLQRGGTGAR